MSVNVVTVSGNLTRDPELRQTQGGSPVLSIGIAVNERRRNQAGEWEDYPNYFDCVPFGAQAEGLSRHLAKGMKVAINGHLHYRSWKDQNGQNRSKVEINVDELEFLSSKE